MNPDPDSPAAAEIEPVHRLAQLVQQIRGQIRSVILGQESVIEQVIAALLAGGHVLLEGKPGLGKTHLVTTLARTFGGASARVQFTPDLMPSDVTGFRLFDMKSQTFQLRQGAVFTNLLLAAEINRAPAKTQAALLEVMQEQQVTIDGETLRLPPPFMTLATQNPVEHEGTYPLPECEIVAPAPPPKLPAGPKAAFPSFAARGKSSRRNKRPPPCTWHPRSSVTRWRWPRRPGNHADRQGVRRARRPGFRHASRHQARGPAGAAPPGAASARNRHQRPGCRRGAAGHRRGSPGFPGSGTRRSTPEPPPDSPHKVVRALQSASVEMLYPDLLLAGIVSIINMKRDVDLRPVRPCCAPGSRHGSPPKRAPR